MLDIELNRDIIKKYTYQYESMQDLIDSIVSMNEDMNYQFLCDIMSDKKFNILWETAVSWLKNNLLLDNINKEIIDQFIQGYDTINDFLDDARSDMLEYYHIYIFFDINGNQTDIHDEAYNNEGLCIEIF